MTKNIDLTCTERLSDSSFVETVWHSDSGSDAGAFTSIAEFHSSMVISKIRGKTFVTVRGPETYATSAYSPDEASFTGIIFKPGVFFSCFPAKHVIDRQDVNLPKAGTQSFWLNGCAWEVPNFENVDTFVDWLVHDGVLQYDPLVNAVLNDDPPDMSLRTLQRRFSKATGLTKSMVQQIDRARYATMLLKNGNTILDTVYLAGYYDQPHLTRSLKQFIGHTPAQLIDENRKMRLSFLYKTLPFVLDYDTYVR